MFLMCVMSTLSFAKVVTVTRSNEGPNGYNTVTEKHETGLFIENTHTLECSDPGDNSCYWAEKPYIAVDSDMNYVEGQINSGNLSGSIVIGNRTITWSGTSSGDFTMTVNLPD